VNADALMKATAQILREMNAKIGETFKKHFDARKALEARVEALEASAATMSLADSHKGTHQRGVTYRRGDLLTCGGALWLALRDTRERPGASDAWRLVVKS
jgi:hypothetical protein